MTNLIYREYHETVSHRKPCDLQAMESYKSA